MFKKFISLFCILTLLLTINANQVFGSDETPKDKAIIVVPGTFASGLFYRGETCTKFNKNEVIWMPLGDDMWRLLKGITKFMFCYEDLFCDEDGNSINKNIGVPLENEKFPNHVDEETAKYGVGNAYKNLINSLTDQFKDYKVFLFNYDWRFSADKSAAQLTEEIKKYDEVILIGHSFGGNVACKSAVQLEKMGQLEKIKKFIGIAVPFNGTVEPFYVLNKGMVTDNDLIGKVIKLLGIPNIVKNMAKNCEPTYQMLPNEDYFKVAEKGYITDKDGKTLNYNETLEFLKDCQFAKKSDKSTKHFLTNLKKVNDDKNILKLLDYHIIAGCGINTMSEIFIDSKNQENITIKRFVDGDGTIALNESATPFNDIEDKRIFKVNGRHQFLASDCKVIENVINTIKDEETFELKKDLVA